jgi:hypothetical protein
MTEDEVLAGLEVLMGEGVRVPAALRLAEQRQAKHAADFRARRGCAEGLAMIDGAGDVRVHALDG